VLDCCCIVVCVICHHAETVGNPPDEVDFEPAASFRDAGEKDNLTRLLKQRQVRERDVFFFDVGRGKGREEPSPEEFELQPAFILQSSLRIEKVSVDIDCAWILRQERLRHTYKGKNRWSQLISDAETSCQFVLRGFRLHDALPPPSPLNVS
jgi:hypothetical protein